MNEWMNEWMNIPVVFINVLTVAGLKWVWVMDVVTVPNSYDNWDKINK